MKFILKIHNGGSIMALRLTKVEIYENGSNKKNWVSRALLAINDIGIDIKWYQVITLTHGYDSYVADWFRPSKSIFKPFLAMES